MDVKQADEIISGGLAAGWHLVAVAVPTRALRVVRDDLALKFRVEQLHPRPPGIWDWKPVSTHQGDEAWESHHPAITDMINKQARLKEKLKAAQHENRMAKIRAENPHGQ